LKIAFMGTPAFAVPSLDALVAAGHELVLVVTNPDRPKGRGSQLQAPEVKLAAERLGLPIKQIESIKDCGLEDHLRKLELDLIVVVAFGHYLPKGIRQAARACINVHGSLLPKHRGAAPIAQAILDGESEFGVTIIEVARKMDAGRMWGQARRPANGHETTGRLMEDLAILGARCLIEAIDSWARGSLQTMEQDESQATLVGKMNKADGDIHWTQPASRLERMVRAYDPWPGTRFIYQNDPIALLRVSAVDGQGPPGLVLALDTDSLTVACGQGALRLLEVKPAGKKAMSAAAWARGRRIAPGARLDNAL
jgi:methionyl-tRNA formyltransferase